MKLHVKFQTMLFIFIGASAYVILHKCGDFIERLRESHAPASIRGIHSTFQSNMGLSVSVIYVPASTAETRNPKLVQSTKIIHPEPQVRSVALSRGFELESGSNLRAMIGNN